MSLADIKRRIIVGTRLKLVRHDFLKLILVRGNLGDTKLMPKIHIGLIRTVDLAQTTQIALTTVDPATGDKSLSYLQWPKAKAIRETPNGFEIDLDNTGEFKNLRTSTYAMKDHSSCSTQTLKQRTSGAPSICRKTRSASAWRMQSNTVTLPTSLKASKAMVWWYWAW